MLYNFDSLNSMSDNEIRTLSWEINEKSAKLVNNRNDGSDGHAVYSIYRAANGRIYIRTFPLLGNPSRIILPSDIIEVI
jgi:hypothetical protein